MIKYTETSLSIGKAALILGVCVATLRRWHKTMSLVPDFVSEGGHRRYKLSEIVERTKPKEQDLTVCYARVSSHGQKEDLTRQAERLKNYCDEKQYEEVVNIKDLGSGLNYKKKRLKQLINLILTGKITRLILTYKDRLLRFGSELVFELCKFKGTEVIIIDESSAKSLQEELCTDVIELMTVFSARLHGSRSHHKTKTHRKVTA